LGWNSPRLYRGIGRYALEAGWHLDTRHFYTETIPKARRAEGMLCSRAERPDLVAFMRRQAPLQPTVVIGDNPCGIRAPLVTADSHAAGVLAARHFIERGYRHFAWFSPVTGPMATCRRQGFVDALTEAGFNCHILDAQVREPSVGPWLVKRLRVLPRPLALFVLDDQVASQAIEICLEQQWRVPEEIAVLGVGNIEIACECSHVPISSVDLDEEEIAYRAAALLDRLMDGKPAPVEPIIIPPRGLLVRKSTDNLVVTDPELNKAVDFILANFHRPLSLDQIGEEAGISRRTLYRLFERDLGRTPADFIVQTRLEHAKRLLRMPRANAAKIAEQCGFGTLRTLTNLFLKQEGVTACAWQQANAALRAE
jgi:LacI family transcriptional regulator